MFPFVDLNYPFRRPVPYEHSESGKPESSENAIYQMREVKHVGAVPQIDSEVARQTGGYQKSTVLHDVGGWWLIFTVMGVVGLIGVVLDYFWNYLVLYVTLHWQHISIPARRKLLFCLIITPLGLFIDWLYYEFTWGTLVWGSLRVSAAFPQPGEQLGLEVSTILIPMVAIGVVNFGVSRVYLRLSSKQAAVLGAVMGVFTAPWLIVASVLLNWP